MKTYTVCVPVDYIRGYLRYGHAEYTIEAESKEEAIEKLKTIKNTIKEMEEGKIPDDPEFEDIDYDDIVADGYSIEECGDFDFSNMWVE